MKTLSFLAILTSLICPFLSNAMAGQTAVATAQVNGGFVVGYTITEGGSGYTNDPIVQVVGGGGSGATAMAMISSGGVVTNITVVDTGSGYTSAPQVIITPPIIPLPQIVVSPASQLYFTNLVIGIDNNWDTSYFLMKNISGAWSNQEPYYTDVFGGPPYGGAPMPIGSSDGSYSTIVAGGANTNLYCLAQFPIPLPASATAQIVNGFVTGITVTSSGDGYLTAPTVQLVGGGGSGAQATATVGLSDNLEPDLLLSITINSPGSGYTSPPTVVIGPPTATLNLTYPTQITPMVRLDLGNTVSNLTYQLQGSPDLVTWTNIGSSYMASSPTNTFYLSATNNAGFYRLQYLP